MGKYTLTKWQNKTSRKLNTDVNNADYQTAKSMSHLPVIGPIYANKVERMEYEENERWWEDYAKNTGINRNRIKYPIKNRQYNGYTPFGIEMAPQVMNLYRKWWKW